MSKIESKKYKCPFCKKDAVYIAVYDDEGNYKGLLGCSYESNPWSGLNYGLCHDGWGECLLCTGDKCAAMGGMLFDTPEAAIYEFEKWRRNS